MKAARFAEGRVRESIEEDGVPGGHETFVPEKRMATSLSGPGQQQWRRRRFFRDGGL